MAHAEREDRAAQEPRRRPVRQIVEDAGERVETIRLLLRQVSSPLVLILLFAAAVSIAVREWTDAAIILLIIVGSTLLGSEDLSFRNLDGTGRGSGGFGHTGR